MDFVFALYGHEGEAGGLHTWAHCVVCQVSDCEVDVATTTCVLKVGTCAWIEGEREFTGKEGRERGGGGGGGGGSGGRKERGRGGRESEGERE